MNLVEAQADSNKGWGNMEHSRTMHDIRGDEGIPLYATSVCISVTQNGLKLSSILNEKSDWPHLRTSQHGKIL